MSALKGDKTDVLENHVKANSKHKKLFRVNIKKCWYSV